MTILFNRVCIIGVGLIGGSLARALRRANCVNNIIGAGRDETQLKLAQQLGVVDTYSLSIAEACRDADCVVLAVPLGAMRAVLAQVRDAVRADTIITDVGSAKQSVIDDAKLVWPELPSGFVPGHPIAGTEKSGVEASFESLYDKRCVIITPTPQSAPSAIDKVRAMWQAAGADVVAMDAVHHDEVLAATSHLPHLLAYVLVHTLAQRHEHQEIFRYAAGGFRDFTRIASSDPLMWRDICLANRDGILTVLQHFETELRKAKELVQSQDGVELQKLFQRAKHARDTHVVL